MPTPPPRSPSSTRQGLRLGALVGLAGLATLCASAAWAALPPRYHYAKKVGRIQSAETAREAANTVVELKVTAVQSQPLPPDARRTLVVARVPHTVTGRVVRVLRGQVRAGSTLRFTMTEVRQLAPGPTRFSDPAPRVGSTVTAHLTCTGGACTKSVAYLGLASDAQFAAAQSRASGNARRHGAPAPAPRRLRCDLDGATTPGSVCLRFRRSQPTPKGWRPGCSALTTPGAPPAPPPRVVCRAAPARRPLPLPAGALRRIVDRRATPTGPKKASSPTPVVEPVCRPNSLRGHGCAWVAVDTRRASRLGRVRDAYARAGWAFACAGRTGLLVCPAKPAASEPAAGQRSAPLRLPALPRR